MKKEDIKMLADCYRWDSIQKALEEKLGYSLRDCNGKFSGEYKKGLPTQDFLLFLRDHYDIREGSVVYIDTSYLYEYAENEGSEFVVPILEALNELFWRRIRYGGVRILPVVILRS